MTSTRSEVTIMMPRLSGCRLVAFGKRPPASAAITHVGTAICPGRAVALRTILSDMARKLFASRMRNRYRRGSTFSTGQVFPFTVLTVPWNEEFQYGGMSESGMYGPVRSLVLGKNSVPSGLKDWSDSDRQMS